MPTFTGSPDEAAQVAAQFPDAEEGTILRTVDEGQVEATMPDGSNSMWYSSAFFDEPDAPHTTMEAADGVEWYAMQPNEEAPTFETPQVSGMETAFTGGGETVSAAGGEATDIPRSDMSAQGTPPERVPFYETAPPETIEPGVMFSDSTSPEVSASDAQFYQGSALDVSQPETSFYGGAAPEVTQPSVPAYEGTHQETPPAGGSFYGESQPKISGYGPQSTPFYGDGARPGADSSANYATPEAVNAYNRAQFQASMPGFEEPIVSVDGSAGRSGRFEVRHESGSGTRFYDATQYAAPKGDHAIYEDAKGGKWYAIRGEPAVERRPVYENGKPVYENGNVKTMTVETVRYKNTPARFDGPKHRKKSSRTPKRKNP